MSRPNYNHRCMVCNSLITYDNSKRCLNGEQIPLDLNGKRHFCSSADKITHECNIVDQLKNKVDDVNNTELSSFGLELRIVDGVENAS